MRKVTKGKLGDLEFQFNPSQIVDSGGVVWSEINSPGMTTPIVQYAHGKSKAYQFEVYVNDKAMQPVNVSSFVRTIKSYRESKEPVIFAFGNFVQRCVINDTQITYQAFDKSLNPIEATINIYIIFV